MSLETLKPKVAELIEMAKGSGNTAPSNAIYEILEYAENGYPKKVKYQIPQGLDETIIPSYAFGNYTGASSLFSRNIEEVEIPDTVTTINDKAFFNCNSLKSITNYDNIIRVGSYAFATIGKQFSIDHLPPNIEIIGSQAFNKTLTTRSVLIIPASVKTIGSKAFYDCWITKAIFRGTPETVNDAFNTVSKLSNIYVPWAEGEVEGAPWGATNATIHYNTTYDADGNPIV